MLRVDSSNKGEKSINDHRNMLRRSHVSLKDAPPCRCGRNVSPYQDLACVVNVYQSSLNVRTQKKTAALASLCAAVSVSRPLRTKAKCAPVGKCICQHLSQSAARTLQSRLPTNLPDKRCHPPLSNIWGSEERVHCAEYLSSCCPCLATFCAVMPQVCAVMCRGGCFVQSVLAKATHTTTQQQAGSHWHRLP